MTMDTDTHPLCRDVRIGGTEEAEGGEGGHTSYAKLDRHTSYAKLEAGASADAGELAGEALVDWDARTEFGQFVADRAKLGIEVDVTQRWRVGGHELAVSFWIDMRSICVLRVHGGWPKAATPDDPVPKALCLAEVFAIATTGELEKLRPASLKRWKVRALAEGGFITVPPVSLPRLPDAAPHAAFVTWRAIAGLLAIRRLTDPPGSTVPLKASWLANWSGGVDENTVRRGKYWLQRRGYIKHVDSKNVGKPKPLYLWAVAGDDESSAAEALAYLRSLGATTGRG
jgi:hypothetical protein